MALEANHLFFRYNKKQPWILEDVSIRLEQGERTALFGPSGCGKTTLGLILAGYQKPERGEVLLDGKPLPAKGTCPVQLIWQHPEQAINPRWKLRQVLDEALNNNYDDLMPEFGIEPEWLNRYPRELSGGELQRFCVLRAMVSGASFLVCDEISTMLDVITQAQIWNAILERAAQQGMGILAITHNHYLAERIADRVIDLSV